MLMFYEVDRKSPVLKPLFVKVDRKEYSTFQTFHSKPAAWRLEILHEP